MAYDKRPGNRGKDGGRPQGDGGFGPGQRSGGGYKGNKPQGGYGKPAQGGGYGKPADGGYGKPAQGSGYGKPAQGGSYGKPAQGGGYGKPAQGGSYGKPAQGGGYGKPASGGYGKPRQGGYGKPADGGYGRPAQGEYGKPADGGYGKPRQGGYGKPAQGSGYGKPAQGSGYGKPAQGGGYGKPAQNGNYGKPAQGSYGKPAFGQRGPGPRRAAPSGKFVPPAARVDEQFRRDIAPTAPVIDPQVTMPIEEDMARDNILVGRNPIREAIKAGKTIDKLLVQTGELSGSARQILAWAHEAHIVVQHVEKVRLDQIYPNHQGMVAFTAAAEYSTVEDILAFAAEKGEEPFVVVLDSITDPHNLGAIIRSAECAGAHGVIITERRSALLSPSAVKASAGASEHQRIAKVVNLSRTLDALKAKGMWVIGADMAGEPALQADLSGPIALVIGSEGEGISHLVTKQCDKLVALPMKGKIDSLNASVAAGILMYEVLRARS